MVLLNYMKISGNRMIKIIQPNKINITFDNNDKNIFIVTSNKNLFDIKLEKFEFNCECYMIET